MACRDSGRLKASTDVGSGASALLVIDMQNDYLHPDGLFGRRGIHFMNCERVIENTRRIVDQCHLSGAPVVYIQMFRRNPEEEPTAWLTQRSKNGLLDLCVPGTWGHGLVDGLRPGPQDLVIQKYRFSAFFEDRLVTELNERGVSRCLFSGVASNGCVDLSLRDAFQLGFSVTGIRDAVSGVDATLHRAALESWANRYGEVRDTNAVVDELARK